MLQMYIRDVWKLWVVSASNRLPDIDDHGFKNVSLYCLVFNPLVVVVVVVDR